MTASPSASATPARARAAPRPGSRRSRRARARRRRGASSSGRDRLLDGAANEPARLHDRHRVDLLDPRHHDPAPAATSPPDASRIGGSSTDQQAAVQQRRLAGDQLRAKARQVADVLVLPDEQRVEPGRRISRAHALEPRLAQPVRIGAVLVVDPELAVREGAEIGARRPARGRVAHGARFKHKPPALFAAPLMRDADRLISE